MEPLNLAEIYALNAVGRVTLQGINQPGKAFANLGVFFPAHFDATNSLGEAKKGFDGTLSMLRSANRRCLSLSSRKRERPC